MVSLISISIDSPLNMSWWLVKNTYNILYGSYCLSYWLIYGSEKRNTKEEMNQRLLLELKKELSELDKKIDIYHSDNNHNNNNSDNDFIKL
jgi:hypothetical protein